MVHMAHTGTIYMTMLVTVERAMVVMKPLKAKYICTRRRAVLVSLGVLVWSVVYNIPRCLEYGTQRTIVQVIMIKITEICKRLTYRKYCNSPRRVQKQEEWHATRQNNIFKVILPLIS